MEETVATKPMGKAGLWSGRVLGWFLSLFMLMDAFMHITTPDFVVKSTTQVGFPVSALPAIGIVEVLAVALYLYPRTATLGAIILTGFFGGAMCVHIRLGQTNFTFALVVAILYWVALFLTEPKVRALVPFRR